MNILDVRLRRMKSGRAIVTLDRAVGGTVSADLVLERLPEAYQIHHAAEAEEVGQALFRALFPPPLDTSLRRQMDRSSEGLRIQLDINHSSLSSYPWEALWNPEDADPFALQNQVSVTRFYEVETSPRSLPVEEKLRWMFAAASPDDPGLVKLPIEKERAFFRQVFETLEDRIAYYEVPSGSFEKLSQMIARDQPHLLYLTAHGLFSEANGAGLALEDDYGERLDIDEDRLHLLFNQKDLRVIVLNSCHSAAPHPRTMYGLAACAIETGCAAVIAMQREITHDSARSFTRGLVEALASGQTLEEAVVQGRRMIFLNSSWQWFIPILFTQIPSSTQLSKPPKITSVSTPSIGKQINIQGDGPVNIIDKMNDLNIHKK